MEELYVVSKKDFTKYFKKERFVDKNMVTGYYIEKIKKEYNNKNNMVELTVFEIMLYM